MGKFLVAERLFLGLTNAVFLLVGAALTIFGFLIQFVDVFSSYYSNTICSLETSLSGAGFSTRTLDFSLSEFAGYLPLALMVSGVLICIISFLGILGATREITWVLLTYGVILIVLMITQIVTLTIFYYKPELFTDPIKDALKSKIKSDYKGLNGTNSVSIGWNFAHQKFSCCGVDSYHDFMGATKWVREYTDMNVVLATPISCCRSLPTSKDFTCARIPLSGKTNNFYKGCFDEMWNMVVGNLAVTVPILSICLLIQIIFTITTIAILYANNNNNDMKEEYKKFKPRSDDSFLDISTWKTKL
ncbi:tetraspanin-21-like [Mytilus californianus]|uniref:tetraspanin-21-like n=1 Tax=Mytilus californianus TaxID=6549 RepID=UPI002246FE3E|nr:tetraspanin-21-like [Mytilus californianus]